MIEKIYNLSLESTHPDALYVQEMYNLFEGVEMTEPLRWWKQLSTTDAQQETNGWLVPYLRFTKSESEEDVWTWFREKFFETEDWQPDVFGEHNVEKADVDFHVEILGQDCGVRGMMITHDPNRRQNNNAPNTWLHYDDSTRQDLGAQDLTDCYAVVKRDANGEYFFTIQAAAPTD